MVELLIGAWKLGWFKTLNISARSWILKLSETRRIWLFLKMEKSRSNNLGPLMPLRGELPKRFAQYTVPLGAGAAPANTVLSHRDANEAGAVGGVKQSRLTYCRP